MDPKHSVIKGLPRIYEMGDQRRLMQACTAPPEPSLFAHIKYSRRRVWLKKSDM